MFLPRAKTVEMEHGFSNKQHVSRADKEEKATQNHVAQEEEAQLHASTDPFVANIPQDLGLDDCLIEDFRGKTIAEQRRYFEAEMRMMAREGHDNEDGWMLLGKTTAKDVAPEDQIDVYQRSVKWSKVKQMRSVAEAKVNCDEFYDYLISGFADVNSAERSVGTGARDTEETRRALDGRVVYPFQHVQEDCATSLYYREIPFPWPFTPRYMFLV